MFALPPPLITAYTPAYYAQVRHLLQHADRLHLHLDWQDAAEWLRDPELIGCIGWQESTPVAFAAVSVPKEGTCWLRALAVGGGLSVGPTVRRLWEALRQWLVEDAVIQVDVLLTRSWLGRPLESLGFFHMDDVVTMRRIDDPDQHWPVFENNRLDFRPATQEDLPAVLAVDQAAFSPIWRLGRQDLEAAWRDADSLTLALAEGRPVGYELSAIHGSNAHLVRLATVPDMQGQGVGRMLLKHALQHFRSRGVTVMTVNTQASNVVSQRLYRHFGFVHTGHDFPVWEARLD